MTSSIVIDTNIALDLLVFDDPACAPLQAAIDAGELRWLATGAMRSELVRVLGYPKIVPRLAFHGRTAEAVMAEFDRHVQPVEPAPRATVVCKDPDDQIFIDLAVAHRVPLRSKDRAVLALRKRLAALGVELA
ncbi:MAG: putative toxin-antitoxin system toxin component, PIN family [Variovorax sp.]